jgi:hypothetical protein
VVAGGQLYGDAMLLTHLCLTQACFRTHVVRGKFAQKHKILGNFKIHFAAASWEFRLTNQTAQQSGFHTANMMIEHHPYQRTMDDIAHLAVATASDRRTVAPLTSTNAQLTLQLETSQA